MINKMIFRKNLTVFIFVSVLVMSFSFVIVSAIQPNGASVTPGNTGTAPNDTAGSNNAYAGNVTELTIFGYSTTQTWQGYFGNVSGTVQLADSNNNVLYNWTMASPSGEVYSSTNSSISWNNIQCFNFTADETYANEAGNGGTTNLHGLNLTGLENRFNVVSSDVDGVNETFDLLGAGTHNTFNTANNGFSIGECRNTRVYDSSGTGVNNNFEEVLLYEPSTRSVVFTSLLDNNLSGFDNKPHDFEMLVLEDGHGTNVATTPYYFFVELQ